MFKNVLLVVKQNIELKLAVMKTRKKFKEWKAGFYSLAILLVAATFVLSSCSDDDDTDYPVTIQQVEGSIVEVAGNSDSFGFLIEAAVKAGLADFLSNEQNLTVFAPTDEAFLNLFAELGVSGIDDIDAATLASVLTYHVSRDMYYYGDLTTGPISSLNTESPDKLPLSLFVNAGSELKINDATVSFRDKDISASNGVIQVIDKVLLPPSVVDIATYSDDFSSLVSAVVKADLAETLSSPGPYTVFAPTNDAFAALFAALGISSLDEVAMEDLTSILTYHVLGENVPSSSITEGMVNTVSGESVQITIDGAVVLNGSVQVVVTDLQATNGVIHVIDAVLVPGMMKSNTIADIAVSNSDFSILVEALMKADLVDAVADPSAELTVFAPTNDAFVGLLNQLGISSLDDVPVDDLRSILLYHVVGGKAMSTDLASGYYPSLSTSNGSGMSIYINLEDGVRINNNSQVIAADIEADNGVIHVIDRVILPPSVVNIAIDNANFTTLVDAVVKAGLADVLSGPGPFTVFAPTNDAFDALFAAINVGGLDDLSAEALIPILTYHVVAGNIRSADLSNGAVGTLNEGSTLMVDLYNGVRINESNVIAADIQGSNGVVHVIDRVLLP